MERGADDEGRAGGVGVEALGHGAVGDLDLHLRRGAAYPQRLVQAPRRRECRRRGQGHRSRHERPPAAHRSFACNAYCWCSREEGRCCWLCLRCGITTLASDDLDEVDWVYKWEARAHLQKMSARGTRS